MNNSPTSLNAKPKVSIIIPVYNREKVVLNTLNNVLENNYRPLELLLIDDGSTDNSVQILDNFKKENESKDFGVKVFTQENKGAPNARNKGIKESTGEYIQFLDSDDTIHVDKIVTQIKAIILENADFCLSDFEKLYIKNDNISVRCSNRQKIKKIIHPNGSFCIGAPLIHSTLARKVKWSELMLKNQDMDYFQKVTLLSKKITYIPIVFYTYYIHGHKQISDDYLMNKTPYLLRMNNLIKEVMINNYKNLSFKQKLYTLKSIALLFLITIKSAVRNVIRK